MSKPLIRIADSQFAHGTGLGSGDLKLPLTYFDWIRTDKPIGNDIIFITESCFHAAHTYPEKFKIAWLLEPRSINPSAYEWIRNESNYSRFTHILTHNVELITYFSDLKLTKDVPVLRWYPFGGCWIYPEARKLYPKDREKKNISILASPKRQTEGHKLRHAVIEKFGHRIDGIFNDPSKYLGPEKIISLRDYNYSIIIENEKSDTFFTEKLIDCFMTGTIPIYWGSGNVQNIFDVGGIRFFSTLDDLGKILDSIDKHGDLCEPQDLIRRGNFDIASRFTCPEDWLWRNFISRRFAV